MAKPKEKTRLKKAIDGTLYFLSLFVPFGRALYRTDEEKEARKGERFLNKRDIRTVLFMIVAIICALIYGIITDLWSIEDLQP